MDKKASHLDPRTHHLLTQTTQFFAQHEPAYLVGGSVRNLLLQAPCADWDIATAGDFQQLGRQLAKSLGGYYAPMHEKACRVVVKHDEQEFVVDLAPLHGETIEADLRERDFTLNAIAAPLSSAVHHLLTDLTPVLIDPLGGAEDLRHRRLRAVSDTIFQKDPLRMLRAMRFMVSYELTLEPQTEVLVRRDAPLLLQAAGERIREELYAILRPAGATRRLRQLDAWGLLTVLVPELSAARGMPQPSLHHWDVFEHSLETVAGLEQLAEALAQEPDMLQDSPLDSSGEGHLAELARLVREAEQQQIFHIADLTSAPVKLAALLHDIGKPPTYAVSEAGAISFYHHPQVGVPLAHAVMRRLQASTRDRRLVQQVVAHHMRPGQLSGDTMTARALRRYFVDLGPTGILVALVSLADHLAMRGPLPLMVHWQRHLVAVRQLLTGYIRERERIQPPRLLYADELMRRFRLAPGPQVGRLLEIIAEAQAEGRVRSKEEAFWLVEETLRDG